MGLLSEFYGMLQSPLIPTDEIHVSVISSFPGVSSMGTNGIC